jgi:hypothetical protein
MTVIFNDHFAAEKAYRDTLGDLIALPEVRQDKLSKELTEKLLEKYEALTGPDTAKGPRLRRDCKTLHRAATEGRFPVIEKAVKDNGWEEGLGAAKDFFENNYALPKEEL